MNEEAYTVRMTFNPHILHAYVFSSWGFHPRANRGATSRTFVQTFIDCTRRTADAHPRRYKIIYRFIAFLCGSNLLFCPAKILYAHIQNRIRIKTLRNSHGNTHNDIVIPMFDAALYSMHTRCGLARYTPPLMYTAIGALG